jgi:hypothetical protein
MYGNLVVSSDIGCTTGGWYHGGMNMHGSSVGHPKGPISGLKGGSLGGFPSNELLPNESPHCFPSDGWWLEPLGMWGGKLEVTCTMVGTGVITAC